MLDIVGLIKIDGIEEVDIVRAYLNWLIKAYLLA